MHDLFGLALSIGTIHNWVVEAAQRAAEVNRAQDLSGVRVGLHDEIFQGNQPVLAGIDAASTYCYLLQGVEQRGGPGCSDSFPGLLSGTLRG